MVRSTKSRTVETGFARFTIQVYYNKFILAYNAIIK